MPNQANRGFFRIRAAVVGLALLPLSLPAIAQQAGTGAASADSTSTPDQTVSLARFVVQDTQGKGYVANDSASGLKSNTLLIDVPQNIQIIPRDVIEDLSFNDSTVDIVKYASAGVVPFAEGDFIIMRGYNSGSGAMLIDGQYDHEAVAPDPAVLDSIEVVKGPAQMLFGPRVGLAGLVNKHIKQPLPYAQQSISVSGGGGRLFRGELDSTGPLAKLGSTKVTYRLIYAKQDFDGFRPSSYNNHWVINGGLKFDFSDSSSLLLQGDRTNSWIHGGVSNYFQSPTDPDKTYLGPGSQNSYSAKWGYENAVRDWDKATFKHAFGENWTLVAGLSHEAYTVHADEIRNNGDANWTTLTLPQYNLNWKFHRESTSLDVDVNGKYEIFGMRATTLFGIAPERNFNHDHEYDFSWPDQNILNPATPFSAMPNEDQQIAQQVFPGSGVEYRSWAVTDYLTAYLMETLEVWRNHLTLVAGTTAAEISGTTYDYVANTTSTLITKGKPHRLGVIYKPFGNDNVSLYFNNSTAFSGGGGLNIHTGGVLPPEVGEVKEGGIKTAIWNGRISSTITYFKQDVTNIPVLDLSIRPGGYYPGGTQFNKGVEFDLAFELTKDWSLVVTDYSGNLHDQGGGRLPNTINHSSSLISRYDFRSGILKGFHLGVSGFHEGDRVNPNFAAFTVLNAFGGYKYQHYSINLNVDNLTDKTYSPGGWASFYHEIAPPLNAHVTLGYRY